MFSKDYVLIRKKFLSKDDCNILIKDFKDKVKPGERKAYGYDAFDLVGTSFIQMQMKIKPLWADYIKLFPESDLTKNRWSLTHLRFKKFKPGKAFNGWHSEHNYNDSTRVLNIQLYLSDHECGTEFYNGETIKSEIGKVAIFPSYFTHTHRGQKCPDNKTRYIITGHVNFLNL